jgi:aryl-alcohol dehydrogenase-like predicted oxidoreductase
MAHILKPFPTVSFGKTEEQISRIGFGAMGLSFGYGKAQAEKESLSVLNEAINHGCTFIDTADAYGDNELLLSKVLKERRNEVFLCTKFGIVKKDGVISGVCGTPEYVRECCEKSLKRLQVDTIDLYYQHRVDADTPIEETVKAMAELVKEGKVKYLGMSECSAETLRRACKVHPITAVQVEYSPWSTDIERNGLLQACRENNVTIIAFSPLGKGFLTGRFKTPEDFDQDDFRRVLPRFQGENFEKNLRLVDKITSLAKEKGVTPGQLALAWVCAQGDDVVPIPGTKNVKYLHENLAATSVTLTKDEEKAIREMIDSIGVEGERYPPQLMKYVNL